MANRWWVIAAATLAAACATSAVEPPASEPTVEGTVTELSLSAGGSALGTVLVEERPGQTSGDAKYRLTVTPATAIMRPSAGGFEPLPFDAVAVGMRVRVWVTGPVMESYPMQASAGAIVLIAD